MRLLPLLALLATSSAAFAQTPAPPPSVKPIPPPGVAIPDADRAELTTGVAALGREIASLRTALAGKPELLALLPDVMIFHKAVDWALRYDEFFDVKQVAAARAQLAAGMERAKSLREGRAPWNEQAGLVVRGYLSGIDGSVQPYGLVIPDDWKPADKTPRRVDFWCHGRAEKLSELAFNEDRMKNRGEFTPPGAIVLHLYGRYCCANKFAGEIDLFEAIANAAKHYPVDKNRLTIRGFSMGGASAWQFATHYSGLWAAAAPGAGFAETAEFFRSFGPGKTPPPWWEQVLWRWYDSTLYAANLANVPTVAYSGETDGQKQAADIMQRFLEKEGLTIPHIIGPQTGHKYHPESKPKIDELLAAATAKGRELLPIKVRFTTYTLRYHRTEWVQIDRMEKHWERADCNAELVDEGTIKVDTKNVTAFTLDLRVNPVPLDKTRAPRVLIDGQEVVGPAVKSPWSASFTKTAGKWAATDPAKPPGLHKTHGLTGPVDDAFMSSFIFVRPTGKPLNDKVGGWVKAELEHAVAFWRKTFRGEVRVIDDTAVTPEMLSASNLVLWGDPSSNKLLAKVLPQLPLKWSAQKVEIGTASYSAAEHAPIMIFPNPLNPRRYIVLNSGATFREQANLNNSDQTPKLPDWAIVDLRTPPDARTPGLVVEGGFFDENWH